MRKKFIIVLTWTMTLAVSGLAQLIQPSDLVYEGAFRLPDEEPYEASWNYAGQGMTYFPNGEPGGPDDGYPGSIFGVGHAWTMYVSEISIPVPVISSTKDLSELNTAITLQGFHDVRTGLFDGILDEMLRVGIEYLPKQGSQTTDKLHIAWGQHFQYELVQSHTWCELDLFNPQTAGPWYFSNYSNFSTDDYIFAIPQDWADANTPGKLLATGRFRDGGLGGRGPALFAYGPWNEGNPPAPNDTLRDITPLLLYDNYDIYHEPNPDTLINYNHPDEWSGGAWLTADGNSAVIFVGTKGYGESWYGCPDGGRFPEVDCEERGWWCDSLRGQIIFYDPSDLAAVARGEMEPSKPQPYASLDIDQYLFNVTSSRQKEHVGAASFDRENGLLYVFEPRADEDKCLVHVWRVTSEPEKVEAEPKIKTFELCQNYPNPFNPKTTIEYLLARPSAVTLKVFDVLGRDIATIVNEELQHGEYKIVFDAQSIVCGVYFYQIQMGDFLDVKKMVVLE